MLSLLFRKIRLPFWFFSKLVSSVTEWACDHWGTGNHADVIGCQCSATGFTFQSINIYICRKVDLYSGIVDIRWFWFTGSKID